MKANKTDILDNLRVISLVTFVIAAFAARFVLVVTGLQAMKRKMQQLKNRCAEQRMQKIIHAPAPDFRKYGLEAVPAARISPIRYSSSHYDRYRV